MYEIGQVMNGHQWNGAAWLPVAATLPAPPAPPAPPAAYAPPPPPNPHAMDQGIPPAPGYAPPPAAPVPGYTPAPAGFPVPPASAGGAGQPGRMKTGRTRFSYLFVNPRDQKGKQRVTLLFPKAPGVYEQLAAKRDEAIRAKVKGDMPQYYRDPIKDGDTYRNPQNQKPLGEECRGHWVINAVGNDRALVEILDEYGNQITAPNAVRSGDWGRASITFYYSTKDNNLGVNVALNSLIYVERGEPLSSSGMAAEDEFAGEFKQAPPGYQPPGAGYAPPAGALPAPAGYAPPPAPPGGAGFAPPPQVPAAAAQPAAQPMVWDTTHNAWVPNPAFNAAPAAPPQAPPAPPAPPQQMTPPGPPPGAPLSPDGKYWWNAGANQWVPL